MRQHVVLAEGMTFTFAIEHAKSYGQDVDIIRVGSGISTTYSVCTPNTSPREVIVGQVRVKVEVFTGLALWERLPPGPPLSPAVERRVEKPFYEHREDV